MKFEIGKQYKTRGGWRAMLVKVHECKAFNYEFWHEKTGQSYYHDTEGKTSKRQDRPSDIISEWTEGQFDE